MHTPDSGGGTQLPAQKPLPADGMWQWCVHTGMASYPSCFLNNELFVKSLSVPSPIQKALSATEETGFDTNRIIIVCYTQPGCLCFCWGEANTVWNIILRFFFVSSCERVRHLCRLFTQLSTNFSSASHGCVYRCQADPCTAPHLCGQLLPLTPRPALVLTKGLPNCSSCGSGFWNASG